MTWRTHGSMISLSLYTEVPHRKCAYLQATVDGKSRTICRIPAENVEPMKVLMEELIGKPLGFENAVRRAWEVSS